MSGIVIGAVIALLSINTAFNAGVFFRLGALQRGIEDHERRLDRLEPKGIIHA